MGANSARLKRPRAHSRFRRPNVFRSGARGLHVPAKLPPESTKREARKRRATNGRVSPAAKS